MFLVHSSIMSFDNIRVSWVSWHVSIYKGPGINCHVSNLHISMSQLTCCFSQFTRVFYRPRIFSSSRRMRHVQSITRVLWVERIVIHCWYRDLRLITEILNLIFFSLTQKLLLVRYSVQLFVFFSPCILKFFFPFKRFCKIHEWYY